MPICSNKSLIQAGLFVSSYFRSAAENVKSGNKTAPEAKYTVDFNTLNETETNLQNQKLIRFYFSLIKLDKRKYELKSNEDIKDVVLALEALVIEQLKQLHNDPELWVYLTNNSNGYECLFYLIKIHIIHKKGVAPQCWILEEFLKTAKDKNIVQVLQYLKFYLNKDDKLPRNNLIELQYIFDSEETPETKMQFVEYSLASPKKLNKKNIPEQANQLIDILFSYSLIMSSSFTLTDFYLYGETVEKCVEKGFLSASLKMPPLVHTNKLFYQIYFLRKNIDSSLYHHVLTGTSSFNLLEKLFVSITRKYIESVDITDRTIIPPEIIADLIISVDFIFNNTHYKDLSLKESQNQRLWRSVIKILSQSEDQSDSLHRLNKYIDQLIVNNDIKDLKLLVFSFLEINEMGMIKLEKRDYLKSILPENEQPENKNEKLLQSHRHKNISFAPSSTLLKITKIFCDNLNTIEVNIENHQLEPLKLKEYVTNEADENNLDESNQKLIELFKSLNSILIKSENAKKNKSNNTLENSAEIASLILKADAILTQIQQKKINLWNFLLSWQEGRDAMYFLVSVYFDHAEKNKKKNNGWRDVFLHDSTRPEEIDILRYLHLNMSVRVEKVNLRGAVINLNVNTPLLHGFKTLVGFEKPEIKFKEIINLVENNNLKIGKHVITRIVRQIKNNFTYSFLYDVSTQNFDHLRSVLAIQDLVITNYLPDFLYRDQSEFAYPETLIFSIIYQYYRYLKSLKKNYTISNHFNMNQWSDEVVRLLIMSVIHFESANKIASFTITEADLKELLSDAYRMLLSNSINDLSHEDKNKFFHGLISLYLKVDPKKAYQKLNQVVDNLSEKHQNENARLLFDIIIMSDPDNVQNHTWLSLYLSIVSLPEKELNDCKDDFEKRRMILEFKSLLNNTDKSICNIDALTDEYISDFSYMKNHLRKVFSERLKYFQSIFLSFEPSESEKKSILKLCDVLLKISRKLEINQNIDQNDFIELSQKYKPSSTESNEDKSLDEVNDYVLTCFKFMEHAFKCGKPDKPYFQNDNYLSFVPDAFEPVFNFYIHAIDLIKLSHTVRNTRLNCDELAQSLVDIYKELANLQAEHPILWEKTILPSFAGRQIIYLLMLDHASIKNSDVKVARSLIKSLLIHASTVEEIEILEFIDYLICKFNEIPLDKLVTELQLKNRLITIYSLFSANIDIDLRMRVLDTMTQTQFPETNNIPKFVYIVIRTYIANACLNQIDINDPVSAKKYIERFSALSDSNYFPVIFSTIKDAEVSSILKITHMFSQFICVYLHQFTFYKIIMNDTLFDIYIILHYQAICLFAKLKQRGWINNEVVYTYTKAACEILLMGLLPDVSPQKIQEFCCAVIIMLRFLTPLDEYINQTNKTITKLFLEGSLICAKSILFVSIIQWECSLQHDNDFRMHKQTPDIKKYKALLQFMQLIYDISEISEGIKTSSEIEKDITNISQRNYDFDALTISFLNSKFPELLVYFKKQLIDHIKLKTLDIKGSESLKSFQHKVIQLAKFLGLSETELNEIKQCIHFDSDTLYLKEFESPLFDSETPQKKKKGKKDKYKPVESKREIVETDEPSVETDELEDSLRMAHFQEKSIVKPSVKIAVTERKITIPPVSSNTKQLPEKKVETSANKNSSTTRIVRRALSSNLVQYSSFSESSSPTQLTLANMARVKIVPPKWTSAKQKNIPLKVNGSLMGVTQASTTITAASVITAVTVTEAQDPTKMTEKKEDVSENLIENEEALSQSLFSFFGNDDDFTVNPNQFHPEFLKFAKLLHDLTFPMSEMHVHVTGGAIPYLYEKKPNPYDTDVIVFANNIFLFTSLKDMHYDCEIIGMHKTLRTLIPIQECDLIFLKYLPPDNNLHQLGINSDAAYIRYQKNLYYYNKQKNIFDQIPLSNELIEKFDRKLKPSNNARSLSNYELNQIRLIIDPYPFHIKSLEIDITCIDPACYQLPLNELSLIKMNINERDLTQSAAVIKFEFELELAEMKLRIDGSSDILYSLKHKVTNPVNSECLFFSDLIHFFRVSKTHLKHTNYNDGEMIKNFKTIEDGKYVVELFDRFIFNETNISKKLTLIRQIGSKLDELLLRFDLHHVITELYDIYIIKGLTGIIKLNINQELTDILDIYLDTLPESYKKLGIYYFLYAFALLNKLHFNVEFLDLVTQSLRTKEQLIKQMKITLKTDLIDEMSMIDEQIMFKNHIEYIKQNMQFRMKNMTRPEAQVVSTPTQFTTFLQKMREYHQNQAVLALDTTGVQARTYFQVP